MGPSRPRTKARCEIYGCPSRLISFGQAEEEKEKEREWRDHLAFRLKTMTEPPTNQPMASQESSDYLFQLLTLDHRDCPRWPITN